MNNLCKVGVLVFMATLLSESSWSEERIFKGGTYSMGKLKSFDSTLKVGSIGPFCTRKMRNLIYDDRSGQRLYESD